MRAGVLHTTFTCEQQQKRHYVEKPGKSKTTKGRARKSAKPLSAPDDTQSEEHKAFAEWVEHYGLGKTDGAAEWRDQKLDAKVAELFRQTLESGRVCSFFVIQSSTVFTLWPFLKCPETGCYSAFRRYGNA